MNDFLNSSASEVVNRKTNLFRSGSIWWEIRRINMPGKTRKPSVEEKLKQNIEFLDALLADLQATSPTISTTSPAESRGRQTANGRDSPDEVPPPLPPPPPFEALDPHASSSKDDVLFPPPAPSSSLGQNLSELDSLLENLSNPLHYPSPSESPGKLGLYFLTKFSMVAIKLNFSHSIFLYGRVEILFLFLQL